MTSKKIVKTLFLGLGLFSFILLFNTFRFSQKGSGDQTDKAKVGASYRYPDHLREDALERLSKIIQIQTVSHQRGADESVEELLAKSDQAFAPLHTFMRANFPLVHQRMDLTTFPGGTQLYSFTPKKFLDMKFTDIPKPGLLYGHMDTVPVPAANLPKWTHPPYSGKIAEGHVWGRGSIDDKGRTLQIFEAMESIFRDGGEEDLDRPIFIITGHDEEIGGVNGALEVVEWLKSKMDANIQFEYVLDEGGIVATDSFDFLSSDHPVALVGVAQKGYVSFKLSAEGEGGHSSMPKPRSKSAILKMAEALRRLEANPAPYELTAVSNLLQSMGRDLPFSMRLLFGNQWLFSPLLESKLKNVPSMNAMIRTTFAFTMMGSGTKENVLPQAAWAMVNLRLYPGDSMESMEKYFVELFEGLDIKIERMPFQSNPSKFSSEKSWVFKKIKSSLEKSFYNNPKIKTEKLAVAPFLVVVATDGRHFQNLTEHLYNVSSFRLKQEDLKRIHGIDERIAIEDHFDGIAFFRNFLESGNS